MASTQAFQRAYEQLNKEQQQAVDTIEGPVMVIAGPGTGKTQVLTMRIANILRQVDIPPDSVLALTFTESGVYSMRRRLVELIGSAGYRVSLYTFHGFCNDIIQQFPDAFPRIIGAQHMTDVDKITTLQSIIQASSFEHIKPFGNTFHYVDAIAAKISELKRENISPERLSELLAAERAVLEQAPDRYHERGAHAGKEKVYYRDLRRRLEKNEELQRVYAAYQERLMQRHRFDYEDMIMEVIRELSENEDLLLQLQERYQYLLADEHQDANNAQNQLLELLAAFHEQPNLFIVGDEKQAIYRFQGASLDNFLYFRNRFTGTTLITLTRNYRSTQTILDAAHSSIVRGVEQAPTALQEARERSRQPLTGVGSTGDSVRVGVFSSVENECLFVARDVQALIADGVDPREIAVLYRTNRDAETLTAILEKEGVPYLLESGQNVLHDPDIRKFLVLLRAIDGVGDDERLVHCMHLDFLRIDNLDLYRIARFAWQQRTRLFDAVRSPELLARAGVAYPEKLQWLYQKLVSWQTLVKNYSLLASFERVAHESGFLSELLARDDVHEKLEKLHGFFRNAEQLVTAHREYGLSEFLHYVDLLEEYNLSIAKDTRPVTARGVRLMTAHKAKGQEFDHVYVIHAFDGHWGNRRAIEHFSIPVSDNQQPAVADDDDERRLFYVALTRARERATVSYADTSERGRQRMPSQYLEELDGRYCTAIDTTSFETTVSPEAVLKPRQPVAVPPVQDREFLANLFFEQGLSVTALNNYLRCPWEYFYSSLLRVPKAPTKHPLFGNAVHAALKYFFDKWREEQDIGEAGLQEAFAHALMRQPLSEHDYAEALAQGKEALAGYYRTYHGTWRRRIQNELSIGVTFDTGDSRVGAIRLRGDLDKVEWIDDRTVHVIDYKTGKPKSRNAIEGKTKSDDGDFKRQLTFYRVLMDHYASGAYHMATGEIDFVQPDDRGRYRREVFTITDEEVAELKRQIASAAHSIATLSFWGERCGERDCEYCALRDMMESQM
jgi:DNA helicase-2/ATP-dependent DNA helicase PcrA